MAICIANTQNRFSLILAVLTLFGQGLGQGEYIINIKYIHTCLQQLAWARGKIKYIKKQQKKLETL